jgi:hypothetical protein
MIWWCLCASYIYFPHNVQLFFNEDIGADDEHIVTSLLETASPRIYFNKDAAKLLEEGRVENIGFGHGSSIA